MITIELPQIEFGEWQNWHSRPRPSRDLDVPANFGIFGLYIFARFESQPDATAVSEAKYLQEEVIYIGMSSHVDQRLEKSHRAASRYRESFSDPQGKNLWFSVWSSPWTNGDRNRVIAQASIACYERALILGYVHQHKQFPLLNKR